MEDPSTRSKKHYRKNYIVQTYLIPLMVDENTVQKSNGTDLGRHGGFTVRYAKLETRHLIPNP